MTTFDWSILRSALVTDATEVVDILVASVLIYGVLRLLRTPANRMPLLGAVILVGIYFVARVFGLFLTEMLLRTAGLALFVVFAIAFQEDIRRAILRWRHWRPFQALNRSRHPSDDVEPLVDLAFQSAEQRIGVLIVLQGHETLEHCVNGGIELLAPIKTSLMQSIFDPHSPGHDGAIVIRDGQIVRICAQLPLSENIDDGKWRGTRHSAGLGLSERTDALILIVSEERGIVSLAQNGRLVEIASAADLTLRLGSFLAEHCPATHRPRLAKRLFQHSGLKVASLAIAALGWFLFARQGDTIEQTFVVPIEYRNIPTNLCLEDRPPAEARLTLSGPDPAFALLSPSSLRVRVELGGYDSGAVDAHLTEQDCVHPPDLSVYRIEPSVLHFRLIPCRTRPGEKVAALIAVEDPTSGAE
ncbi:TIGR00159 family protein [Singulisphaera sp. GP187]|uniref:diadenylate cyclase n=1 Tax=Singulisphaera sp. GP187 TaxID=1882752 RepID=UPI0009264CEA|nr:diadenylate cyclase [Singulisphaera sp. GP187]SIO65570.1 TIGR00159 family protein [Singulisphaera sp. GP187]